MKTKFPGASIDSCSAITAALHGSGSPDDATLPPGRQDTAN
jgi:hypothetical protein